MASHSKFRDFGENFDLASYIDKKGYPDDIGVLKAAKNDLLSKKKDLEISILQEFIQNEDHFMNVLDNYSKVANFKKEIKENLANYKKLIVRLREKEVITFVDDKKRDELEQKFTDFEDDMSLFQTEKRYLVDYVNISVEHNNTERSGVILLTNDFLFVGVKGVNKYKLLNVFSYDLVQMKMEKDCLILLVDPIRLKVSGNYKSLEKVYTVWQEYTYESEKDEKSLEKSGNVEYERYLLETNRFVESKPHLYKVRTYENFEVILKTGNTELIAKFFIRRFTEKLNELCFESLAGTLGQAFHILMKFYDEEKGILENFNLLKYFPAMIEAHIITIMKFLEPKIFWKRRPLEEVNNAIAAIKQSLKWNGYNYVYLLDIYDAKIREHEQVRLGIAKTEISKVIDETQKEK
ncbi:hypothetical protein VCUG_01792 [Vavraia culicis subsp. floridensis]|uniref:Uncharacterized protein n=1 Tax=Vavraia culicis (isolate floridensis) TaxID=948595 RepID=L2GSQ5_VAVCU|nr:uncharacterized protein VCUG_01792 [Vavraia culicis subsp. floridensis]ELA46706.1 hypothetical protein VCUG_01792 [Vavraia culicis subsp. floridensis]